MATDRSLTAKDKLEQAFFELLEEKHYSKIAVSELIEKAGVSRTTFYRHYVDIFDMYDKVCERLLEAFLVNLLSKPKDVESFDPVVLFENCCEMLKSQEEYILLLCGENGGRHFFESLISLVSKKKDSLLMSPEIFTKEDMFKLKFVTLAGIGSYVKALIEGRSAGDEIFNMCRTILMVAATDKENSYE